MHPGGKRTLVIKLGATGDVVRTTPLLRALEGEIHWLTSAYNFGVLPVDCRQLTNVFSIEKDVLSLSQYRYDLVLSLDEDEAVFKVLPSLNYEQLSGIWMDSGKLSYTKESADWFDMSLVSVFDKEQADLLKLRNRKTYQELIFQFAGLPFKGEQYWINISAAKRDTKMVGIETRTGSRWKGKEWWGYDDIDRQLKKLGYQTIFFSERNSLREYFNDIGSCGLILTGDTLAMHVALAYGLPTISLFTCTAPWEIYDYGLLQKITSPLLDKSFYKPEPVADAIGAISTGMVMDVFRQMQKE